MSAKFENWPSAKFYIHETKKLSNFRIFHFVFFQLAYVHGNYNLCLNFSIIYIYIYMYIYIYICIYISMYISYTSWTFFEVGKFKWKMIKSKIILSPKPANTYLYKVNNRNIEKWSDILHLFLVFPLLTLNKFCKF